MSDNEILIPFAQGVAQQGDSLTDTVQRTQAWLNTLDLEAMRRSALLFAGIGASYAVLASPVHELRAAGIRAFRSNGDDMPTGTPVLADWYIGVSQSGRSPEVVRILQQQRHERRLTIVDSSMSSVALMATSVSLGLLTDALIGRDETAGWLTLPQTLAAQRPSADAVIARFVARLNNPGCIDLVGGGSSLSAAEQGALLLREGPKAAAMGMGTRHYLHGMTDAVGNTAHVLIGGEREILLAKQMSAFGVPVLLITDTPQSLPGVETLTLPSLPPLQRLALELLAMELLAIHLGAVLGRDIDTGIVERLDTKINGETL